MKLVNVITQHHGRRGVVETCITGDACQTLVWNPLMVAMTYSLPALADSG